MRTVYVDKDSVCHAADDGTMTAVETDFFDGCCDAFVEGFCLEVSDGWKKIYPRRPTAELCAAQRQYEADQAALEQAYREGVNSL